MVSNVISYIVPFAKRPLERVYLLCHILRMLVEPPMQQHEAIRSVGLDLATLEENTFDALATWFSDKKYPKNMTKKPLLSDLFKVAHQEARYRDGELGALNIFPLLTSHNETYQL